MFPASCPAGLRLPRRRRLAATLAVAAVALTGAALPAAAADPAATQTLTVDGVVRTIMGDERAGPTLNESKLRVVDVQGTLLTVPDADAELLADRQPVTVSITAPDGMSVPDALASAGGAIPGGGATVTSVAPAGEAPVVDSLADPDGLHTITVLPIYWQADDAWVDTVGWRVDHIAEDLDTVWTEASEGRLTMSVVTRPAVQVAGTPTCDPVILYNLAMRAHGEPAPTDPHTHIVILAPRDGLACGANSSAVIGGSQMWPSDTAPADNFGHNLGLGHAGGPFDCPPVDGLTIRSTSDGCTTHDGTSDSYDVMGSSSTATTLHEPFAELLGWGRSVTASLDEPLDIAIYTHDMDSGAHAARIPLSDSAYLYAEVRDRNTADLRRLYWSDGVPYTEHLSVLSRGSTRFVEGSAYVISSGGGSDNRIAVRVTNRNLDTTAPSAPIITSSAEGTVLPRLQTSFALEWSPATDEGTGVTTYRLYVDGEYLLEVSASVLSWERVSIPTGSQRSVYVLQAVDAAGNVTPSAPLVIKREGPARAPENLSVVTGYASAHVSWEIPETHPALTSQVLRVDPWAPGFPVGIRALDLDVRSFEFPELTSGEYQVSVEPSNAMYPLNRASIRFSVAPPTVTAFATATDGHAPAIVSWTLGETTAAPPASFRVAVDGVPTTTAPGDATSVEVPMEPGEHAITVTAIDPWGDEVTSGPTTVSVGPDGPLHEVTAAGVVRTLVGDVGTAETIPARLIADVGGTLLWIPEAETEGLSDGQPIAVTLTAPLTMSADDAVRTAGQPGGTPIAYVTSVQPTAAAPAPAPLDAQGERTVTVLPVSWLATTTGVGQAEWGSSFLETTWEAASSGVLSLEVQLKDLVHISGFPTCDPLAQYNGALVANGMSPALTASQHVAVYSDNACGWSGLAILGGRQMWVSRTSSSGSSPWTHQFGHNLGLGHADAMTCTADAVVVPLSDTCTVVEQGDPGTLMGAGSQRLNAGMAEALGWAESWAPAPTGQLVGNLREGGEQSPRTPLMVGLPDGRRLVVEDGGTAASGLLLHVLDTTGAPTTYRLNAPGGVSALNQGMLFEIPGTGYTVSVPSPGPGPVARARIVPTTIDTQPPTAPVITSPVEWARSGDVAVTWESASDTATDVAAYRVSVDGTLRATVPGELTTATVPIPAGTRTITVAAVDAVGNTAGTDSVVRSAPLPTVTMTTVRPDDSSIHVDWSTVESPDLPSVTGYTVTATPGDVHVDLGPSARSADLTGLDNQRQYTVRVVAHTVAGDSRSTSRVVTPAAPESWLLITSPADGDAVSSPTRLTWDVGPGLARSISYFTVKVDGYAVRYLPAEAREMTLTLQGSKKLTLTAHGDDGRIIAALDVYVDVSAVNPVFRDVALGQSFQDDIDWMLNRGITTGYPDGTFRPTAPINRDAMAAFLFRYAGADIEGYEAPAVPIFSDVPVTHPFYREICWMAETGISTGNSDGTYRPSSPVSRGAMAAFLYRFSGGPQPTYPSAASFVDVPVSHPFHDQITWLASAAITNGYADGTFRPGVAISRGAMAAFLHRMDAQWPRQPFQGTGASRSCGAGCPVAV